MKHPGIGRLMIGALALALTACGSQVDGTPHPGEIDVRHLAVGNYPTDPLDFRMTYQHNENDGQKLAMGRLADNVVIGADVDPKFGHNLLTQFLSSSSKVFAGAVQPVLESNGLLFGYSAAASTHEIAVEASYHISDNFNPFAGGQDNPQATSFTVSVLQFPDPQRARTAADQMEAADFAVAADSNVHLTLDKQPDAKAHWRPGIPSMAATLAHGSYVVNVFAIQPTPDLDGLRKLTDQIFAAQLPLLDQTPALSKREMFHLNYDPDLMLRRTLHPADYTSPHQFVETTHTPRGYLHTVEDQATGKRLLDDNGVDRISTAKQGGLLFRARDPKAATALWTAINQLGGTPADAPPGLPDTTCVQNPNPRPGWVLSDDPDSYARWDADNKYLCTIHYDRYVARVASSQLADAQQKAAAQYAVLANSQYL
ncbi:DUF7373 family lipoprotein [Nocardia sp. NPDC004722]